MPAKIKTTKYTISGRQRHYRIIPELLRNKVLNDLAINHATDGKLTKVQIAKRNAVSVPTVKKYNIIHKDKISEIEKELQYNLSDIARRLTRAVSDDKIKNCTVPQLMVSTGIAIDKSLLLQGRPTEIVSDVPTDDGQLEAFILSDDLGRLKLPASDDVSDGEIVDIKSNKCNNVANNETIKNTQESTRNENKRT